MQRIMTLLPRILGILYILFISMFAFDAFAEKVPFLRQFAGFIIHMIPSLLLTVTLIAAWKYPLIGGIIFLLICVGFTIFFHTYRHLAGILLISGPVFLIGVLFLISWYISQQAAS
jgi:hypothetical protein